MPKNGWPATRLPETPASPPKNSENISDMANTNSATPSVIMANGVPALRVVTQPSKMAKPMPVKPPMMGSKLTGMWSLPALTALSA